MNHIPQENKRELILRVARKLFAEQGYENTSVRQIVEKAETSMGNLYFHFPNKLDILKIICQDFVQVLRQQIYRIREMQIRPEVGFALDFRIGYITTLEHPKTSKFWVATRSIPEIHQYSLENKRIRLKTFFGDRVSDDEILHLAVAIQGIADGIFDQKREGLLTEESSQLSNTIVDYSLRLLRFSKDEIEEIIREVDSYVQDRQITIDRFFKTEIYD
jgi:AcrR family transcriptional regulator